MMDNYKKDSRGHYYEDNKLFQLNEQDLELVMRTNIQDPKLAEYIFNWKCWYSPLSLEKLREYHAISDFSDCPFSPSSHNLIIFDVVNDIQVLRVITHYGNGYFQEGWRIIIEEGGTQLIVSLPDNRYEPSEHYYFEITENIKCRIGGYSYYSSVSLPKVHFLFWKIKDTMNSPEVYKKILNRLYSNVNLEFSDESYKTIDGYFIPISTLANLLSKCSIAENVLNHGGANILCDKYSNEFFHRLDRNFIGALNVALKHSLKMKTRNDFMNFEKLYAQLLELNKDTRNPKFIAPSDINDALKYWEVVKEKKMEKEARKREKELQKIMLLDNDEYRKIHEKYLNLTVENESFVAIPLQDIQEFIDIGNELHNCCASYYKSNKSQVIKVCDKKTKKIIELAELSIPEMNILQCFGPCNKFTEHHDSILELLENYKTI